MVKNLLCYFRPYGPKFGLPVFYLFDCLDSAFWTSSINWVHTVLFVQYRSYLVFSIPSLSYRTSFLSLDWNKELKGHKNVNNRKFNNSDWMAARSKVLEQNTRLLSHCVSVVKSKVLNGNGNGNHDFLFGIFVCIKWSVHI